MDASADVGPVMTMVFMTVAQDLLKLLYVERGHGEWIDNLKMKYSNELGGVMGEFLGEFSSIPDDPHSRQAALTALDLVFDGTLPNSRIAN